MKEKITHYRGEKFRVFKDVYKPAEDTFLLADNLQVDENDRVLELGTGCGILSIISAKKKAEVVATDINPAALECALENAKAHEVEDRIDFRKGDLFEVVGEEKFDIVIFNPPYLPIPPSESSETKLEKAWDGGPDGREIIDRFLDKAEKYLKPGGRLLFLQSSLSGKKETLEKLEENFEVKIKKKKFSFEEIFLFVCEKTG